VGVIHRAARVFADEGVVGLVRRAGRRLARPRRAPEPPPPPPPADPDAGRVEAAKTEYARLAAAFRARCRDLGHAGLDDYYWYHTVDLGDGLVTPGDYDFRPHLTDFGFPTDLTGKRVLDVGSATGFFAFEFERRGAEVVSVELPTLSAWDIPAAERDDVVRRLTAYHRAATPEEAYRRHLDGPFRFCHAALGSRVARCYSSVYDLTLAAVGGEKFDLVYAGDVLLHLFAPLRALDALAGLCRGELWLSLEVPFPGPAAEPLLGFRGHLSDDARTWWAISRGCAGAMLGRLGFRSVAVAGRHSGVARRAWLAYDREVLRATRG
jgi:SAM-dependent methyltransferase